MRDEIKLISQTLSVGLLRYICITLLDVSEDNHPTPGHSRQADVHSTVQEVGNLQAELQATKDEDEQRALQEDITGKILWFYQQGIRSEVDQILAEVVNYIRNEVNVLETDYHSGLREIVEIIKKASHVEDDDITHLQRIMHDAGAGMSRHKSWLTSRAAEQARLSRVLKANSIPVSP
ncbi:hypothetical protein EDC04DRAFT_1344564 [Pisolithus marmoratus]|nr:hypothetical protein EDC04DRAFT_1344564 [Pisolithus marmoratus]